MKWLSGGLTFVNFATLCGLLVGIIAGGLGKGTAILSICLGGAAAILAYVTTRDSEALRNFREEGRKGWSTKLQGDMALVGGSLFRACLPFDPFAGFSLLTAIN